MSGEECVEEAFAVCPSCREEVSSPALQGGACDACLSTKPVGMDDPRVVWVVGEHRGLGKWKRWRLAETEDVYVIRLVGLFKKLLVVIDKETLAVRHLARAGALQPKWSPAPEEEWEQLLS